MNPIHPVHPVRIHREPNWFLIGLLIVCIAFWFCICLIAFGSTTKPDTAKQDAAAIVDPATVPFPWFGVAGSASAAVIPQSALSTPQLLDTWSRWVGGWWMPSPDGSNCLVDPLLGGVIINRSSLGYGLAVPPIYYTNLAGTNCMIVPGAALDALTSNVMLFNPPWSTTTN